MNMCDWFWDASTACFLSGLAVPCRAKEFCRTQAIAVCVCLAMSVSTWSNLDPFLVHLIDHTIRSILTTPRLSWLHTVRQNVSSLGVANRNQGRIHFQLRQNTVSFVYLFFSFFTPRSATHSSLYWFEWNHQRFSLPIFSRGSCLLCCQAKVLTTSNWSNLFLLSSFCLTPARGTLTSLKAAMRYSYTKQQTSFPAQTHTHTHLLQFQHTLRLHYFAGGLCRVSIFFSAQIKNRGKM